MQPARSIFLRAFFVTLLLVCVVTAAGLFFNFVIGFALALVLLMGIWLGHLRQLALLQRWARAPLGTPVPAGFGLWEDAFAALYQRSREQREQRAVLQVTLERFRNLAQTLPDGVVILGKDFSIEWLNTNAELHLGLSAQHDMGYPVTNLLRDEAFVAYLNRREFGSLLELHPLRSPGRALNLQLVAFGEEQVLLLSRDVSQLEKLETMRRDFVANVSHELKTPLTVVSGFIETLIDGLHDIPAEDALHFLGLADEQAHRMRQLIEDLLTLSAMETGAPLQRDEMVSIAALLADVRSEAELVSAGKHQIEVKIDAAATSLLGSSKELRSAFGNLAINAVRYSPSGGKIMLHWCQTPDGGASLMVQDSGIGIAAEHLPRLTERFYRVDRGRSRETGGTGLGLAIVKHALERHQARLDIKSELGQGTTFSAVFPVQRIASGASPSSL